MLTRRTCLKAALGLPLLPLLEPVSTAAAALPPAEDLAHWYFAELAYVERTDATFRQAIRQAARMVVDRLGQQWPEGPARRWAQWSENHRMVAEHLLLYGNCFAAWLPRAAYNNPHGPSLLFGDVRQVVLVPQQQRLANGSTVTLLQRQHTWDCGNCGRRDGGCDLCGLIHKTRHLRVGPPAAHLGGYARPLIGQHELLAKRDYLDAEELAGRLWRSFGRDDLYAHLLRYPEPHA